MIKSGEKEGLSLSARPHRTGKSLLRPFYEAKTGRRREREEEEEEIRVCYVALPPFPPLSLCPITRQVPLTFREEEEEDGG